MLKTCVFYLYFKIFNCINKEHLATCLSCLFDILLSLVSTKQPCQGLKGL